MAESYTPEFFKNIFGNAAYPRFVLIPRNVKIGTGGLILEVSAS